MKNDIEFYWGYRKSGKSKEIEDYIKHYNSKIYIGTLPRSEEFDLTIKEHVLRRGENWLTIELVHNIDEDIMLIDKHLEYVPNGSICLIDGLWTWYVFENKRKNINPRIFAKKIIAIINKYNIKWRIVDIGSYVLEGDKKNYVKIKYIHELFIKSLNINKVIDLRYERV